MSSAVADILPKFEVPETASPAAKLRELGTLLQEQTNSDVIGEVQLIENFQQETLDGLTDFFKYKFTLRAPKLDNYRFLLLYIEYPSSYYPVAVRSDLLDDARESMKADDGLEFLQTHWTMSTGTYQCNDEAEYLRVLGHLFHSDKVKKIIGSLIAQSR